MRGKAIILLLVALLVLGILGASGGWNPLIGIGFAIFLSCLVYSITSLGSKQGEKTDLNKTRPPLF